MTCEPVNSAFQKIFPVATLVMVDMCKSNLPRGLKRAPAGTVLQNCRCALSFARRFGWPVAHVRSSQDAGRAGISYETIGGFEPARADALFERRTLSCYSSPYFGSVIRETAGAAVIAGFLGPGGALSTVADAIQVGDRITVLSDATLDNISNRIFAEPVISLLRAYTTFNISVLTTAAWLRSVEEIPANIAKALPTTTKLKSAGRRRAAEGDGAII